MTEGARQRLGHRVIKRRRALGLSAAEASRVADLNPKTWEALEKGTRTTRDSNYAGIERALQWQHGSIDTILDGGEPQPLPESAEGTESAPAPNRYLDPVTGDEYRDPDERALWDLVHLAEEDRRELIIYLRTRRAMSPRTERRRAG